MSTEAKPRFSAGQWVYAVIDYVRYSPGWEDESGNWHNGKDCTVEVSLQKLLVLKVTAHGAWIDYGADRRWLGFRTRKVSETPEAALQQAIERRAYHARKMQERLGQVQRRLEALRSFKVG